jgi:hypothetical protein
LGSPQAERLAVEPLGRLQVVDRDTTEGLVFWNVPG